MSGEETQGKKFQLCTRIVPFRLPEWSDGIKGVNHNAMTTASQGWAA